MNNEMIYNFKVLLKAVRNTRRPLRGRSCNHPFTAQLQKARTSQFLSFIFIQSVQNGISCPLTDINSLPIRPTGCVQSYTFSLVLYTKKKYIQNLRSSSFFKKCDLVSKGKGIQLLIENKHQMKELMTATNIPPSEKP